MKRDFLTFKDLDRSEIEALFRSAAGFKAERAARRFQPRLAGRTIGMIFDKPSTRTRVSFQVGAYELGAAVVFMHGSETQFARQEPLSHAGRVLSRYLDALIVRTYAQADLEELAGHASIPIINALTDLHHPCQVLSDMFTILEKKGRLTGLKIAWIGDGNNMAHSWIEAAALMGFELVLAVPQGYDPDPGILSRNQAKAAARLEVTRDPFEAAAGADVVNTDVWASMGQEEEAAVRSEVFRPFQVNGELMKAAAAEAIVLHCLPAHLGEEITAEVFEGPQSIVFDQAENRLHVQKALMDFLLTGRLE